MREMYSRGLVLLTAVAALAVEAAPAAAAPPSHTAQHYESDFVWPAGSVCSFAVQGHSVYDGHSIARADNTVITHNQTEETLTNLTTTHQISISDSFESRVDYTTFVAHAEGLLLKVRDGQGKLLFVQTGQTVEEGSDFGELKATPHTLIDRNWLCDTLAQ